VYTGSDPSSGAVKEVLARCDMDQDGRISKSELKLALEMQMRADTSDDPEKDMDRHQNS
jgi:hypothetical protein